MGKLTPAGQLLLKMSQKSWLHYIGIVCPMAPFGTRQNPLPPDPSVRYMVLQKREPVKCLTEVYKERLEQISQAGQALGPYIFNRVDQFAAAPSGDDTGGHMGFFVAHVAYPQIDSPVTPAANKWNRKMVQQITTTGECREGDCCIDEEDCEIDYKVGVVSHGVVSVRWDNYAYGHGLAHGMDETSVETYVIGTSLRPLTAADIFGTSKDWEGKLERLLWKKVQDSGWSYPPNLQSDEIQEDLLEDSRWFLNKDGLEVVFTSYDGGCYACTPPPVIASWNELLPLMSPDSVLRPR
jgi:hypothetical protein